MTTATTATDPAAPVGTDASGLRTTFWLDAGLCLATGGLLVGAADPLADLAGLDTATPVVLPGVFLLVLAVGLAFLARAPRPTLVALAPWSAEGDVAWVAASLAAATLADLTGPGRALVVAQAVVVAAMGVAKLRAARAAR